MTNAPNTTRLAPRLVASDVDGTLLDQHERVSERTKRAVAAVVADGVPFVLSTARPASASAGNPAASGA